jgi:hypothetical protein
MVAVCHRQSASALTGQPLGDFLPADAWRGDDYDWDRNREGARDHHQSGGARA